MGLTVSDWTPSELQRAIERIERELREAATERRADRRIIYAALASAVGAFLVPIFTRISGAG